MLAPPSPASPHHLNQHLETHAPWYSPSGVRMPPPPPRTPMSTGHLLTPPDAITGHASMSMAMPPSIISPASRRMPPTRSTQSHTVALRHGLYPPALDSPGLPMPSHEPSPSAFSSTNASMSSMNNIWICDYCNSAAFGSYEEACAHEEVCKARITNSRPDRTLPLNRMVSVENDARFETKTAPKPPQPSSSSSSVSDPPGMALQVPPSPTWSRGVVSLAVEPIDKEWLSELNCFIRKHCVEAFSAGYDDVAKTSKRGRIAIDQVGIRCKFCSSSSCSSTSENYHEINRASRGVAAVSYPTSLAGIYESVKRWQRVHFPTCPAVPNEIRQKITQLQSESVWVPTTRQYWSDSARILGMVDTAEGIRFDRQPGQVQPSPAGTKEEPAGDGPGVQSMANHHVPSLMTAKTADRQGSSNDQSSRSENSTNSSSSSSSTREQTTANSPPRTDQDGSFVCFPTDKDLVPPYVFFLMRQVQVCHFTEADRFVARSKGPVGFTGFQCRHCNGHAGLGKYFPLTSKALSTNSTSQNIHAHVLKCRKCPPAVKEELALLKSEKAKSPRLVPGWRKTFFEIVWKRLHGDRNGDKPPPRK